MPGALLILVWVEVSTLLHYILVGVGQGHLVITADQSVMHQPLLPAASSIPIAQTHSQPTQVVTSEALVNKITDLAKQIGDSITANLSTRHQPCYSQPQSPDSQPSPRHDQSQLKVVVQLDTKAPPYFKGDRLDAFSIHDWEDTMRCYLSRIDCKTPAEMFDLIMSRLTGKAEMWSKCHYAAALN